MTVGSLSSFEQALVDAATALTARLDVEKTCAAILDAAERMFDARSSWVLLHDGDTDELVTVLFRGPDADSYASARVPVSSRAISAIVFREQRPLFVPDVRDEERWYDARRVHSAHLSTVFTVPLLYESAAVGVLGLDSPMCSADTPPTAGDIARLQAIAAQAAIGIRNARVYDEVEQDRARLRRLLEERRQLRSTVDCLRQHVRDVHGQHVPIATSPAFCEVLAQIELVAPADTTVLLVGETGTGKELVARTIHDGSRRRGQPFVGVNCAAIPEALIESELFGYEKGAFTGAVMRKAGKFEVADRGTMLLDEVGDLPASAQAKRARGSASWRDEAGTGQRSRHRRNQPGSGGVHRIRRVSSRPVSTGCACFRSICRRFASDARISPSWQRTLSTCSLANSTRWFRSSHQACSPNS